MTAIPRSGIPALSRADLLTSTADPCEEIRPVKPLSEKVVTPNDFRNFSVFYVRGQSRVAPLHGALFAGVIKGNGVLELNHVWLLVVGNVCALPLSFVHSTPVHACRVLATGSASLSSWQDWSYQNARK
ncbi:hypothetical protein TREES_T100011634 [Tupaia chinensis]|uniref:Uncharacterized protein n=1 Tax=Tupaia chinensis TaxID=246437 RepID=L9L904_TUPCH|nr:hypothetical protein TREES_T100011634 [Tupaia chinensis]